MLPKMIPDPPAEGTAPGIPQAAVLAGGCFWCVEAVYRQLRGVQNVISGYAGGTAHTANYRDVCTGRTGHAEAVKIIFDAKSLSFGQILKVFFTVAHDPTELNRQGNDVGSEYRSAIFYADEHQRAVAVAYIEILNTSHIFHEAIVTTLEPLGTFYPAEDYHQDFVALNPEQPYIACVALPKVRKLREMFPEMLARGVN